MEPVFGPWVDARFFNDVETLKTIASYSPEVAAGVAYNATLQGSDLEYVLNKSGSILANYNYGHTASLVEGKSVSSQVQVIRFLASRRISTAQRLVSYLSPAALVQLVDEGVFSQDDLNEYTKEGAPLSAWFDPEFVALCVKAGAFNSAVSASAVRCAGNKQELMELSSLMRRISVVSEAEATDLWQDVQIALVATQGFPEVVTHWATEAGQFGVLVAANDYRQSPELLSSLSGPGVGTALASNGALSWEHSVTKLADQMHAAVLEHTLNDGTMRKLMHEIEDLRRRKLDCVTSAADVSDTNISTFVEESSTNHLLLVELVQSGRLSLEQTAKALDTLIEHFVVHRFVAELATPQVVDSYRFYESSKLYDAHPDLLVQAVDEADANYGSLLTAQAISDIEFTSSGPVCAAAEYIAQVATTPAQLTGLLSSKYADVELYEALQEVAGLRLMRSEAMRQLIPSGLGDI